MNTRDDTCKRPGGHTAEQGDDDFKYHLASPERLASLNLIFLLEILTSLGLNILSIV